jgi:hypothetical protein
MSVGAPIDLGVSILALGAPMYNKEILGTSWEHPCPAAGILGAPMFCHQYLGAPILYQVFCILQASQATNPKMVKMNLEALDKLYDMSINIVLLSQKGNF